MKEPVMTTNPHENGKNSRTRKYLIALGATAGIAFGGLAVANVASAQTDDIPVEELPLQVDPPAGGETPAAPGDGEPGEDGRRGCGGDRGHSLEGAAAAIGIEADALREALRSGQSMADVATANGVDPAAVVDALVADAEARLAEKVADGTLTQAEADERLAGKAERIEDRVDRVPGDRPDGQQADPTAQTGGAA
jgi:hypothetical protein